MSIWNSRQERINILCNRKANLMRMKERFNGHRVFIRHIEKRLLEIHNEITMLKATAEIPQLEKTPHDWREFGNDYRERREFRR